MRDKTLADDYPPVGCNIDDGTISLSGPDKAAWIQFDSLLILTDWR
jgi:hypothetical protein